MALRTIKSSGGDYTSLSAWEAGRQANLTGAGPEEAECYSINDTTQVVIDGWTTTAADYIRIYTPTTERHDGKFNSSKYRLGVNIAFDRVLKVLEEYVRLEGLQIGSLAGANGRAAIYCAIAATTSDFRISECIIYNGGGDATRGHGIQLGEGHGIVATVRNCVIYNCAASGIVVEWDFTGNNTTVNIYNCTIAQTVNGVNRINGTCNAYNVYAHGTTAAYTGTITKTTCASSDTSGTAGLQSIAHSTANFTNVTASSEDYHLVGGSALIGVGTDESGVFTNDIDGQTRSVPWDIGADETASAAVGAMPLGQQTTMPYLLVR